MGRRLEGGSIRGKAGRTDVVATRSLQKGSIGTGVLGVKGCRGWAPGVEYQGGGCARGGQMCPDADLPVRTHWARPFHLLTECAQVDAPRTGVYVISAWNVRCTG